MQIRMHSFPAFRQSIRTDRGEETEFELVTWSNRCMNVQNAPGAGVRPPSEIFAVARSKQSKPCQNWKIACLCRSFELNSDPQRKRARSITSFISYIKHADLYIYGNRNRIKVYNKRVKVCDKICSGKYVWWNRRYTVQYVRLKLPRCDALEEKLLKV